MAERILVVECPDWPVVAAGFGPGVPVAVIGANVVVACSGAARAAGVEAGLRRRQARSRCPNLVVVDQEPGRDARVFEPIVVAVESFTPRVEIVRAGLCAFATRGPSRYFGGDAALAAKVAHTVDGVLPGDATCRVGVADGRFAAELAASLMARVPRGRSAAFLAPLPVDTLDDPALVHLLRRLGLRTLGDLAALPASAVMARFGPAGRHAHRLARGLDDLPLSARAAPADFTVSVELDPPVVNAETATFAAKSLADQLCEGVAGRGLVVTSVRVEAETEHGEHRARVWRHDGGLTAAAMAQRVRWQLDGWTAGTSAGIEDPTGGITLLRLVPTEVVPDHGRQGGFWGSGPTGAERVSGARAAPSERVSQALARLQGTLGHEAVVTGVATGGRSPAEQLRLVPWGEPLPATGVGVWPGAIPPPAPATVHFRPVPAEVVDVSGAPVKVTGRGQPTAEPVRVRIAGGSWADVEGWAGPWPLDERWWDIAAHRRRARWQMATADGAAHLLAVEGGRWWLEATYD